MSLSPIPRQLLDAVFEGSSEAILITDPQARITAVNSAFQQITGYTAEESLGQNPRFLAAGLHTPVFYQEMWSAIRSDGRWQGEIWNRRKNGEVFPEWLSIQAVRDEDGQTVHYMGVFSDLTERKATAAAIERLVHHDPLTGLPNRILLRDRLGQMLAVAQRRGTRVAVLCLDLDRFKTINGSLGHCAGDRILQETAARIRASVREIDTVSRFGADEIVVLLPEITQAADAARVAERILQSLARPCRIGERELMVTASLGLSLYPENGITVDDLLRSAEVAMYHVKENGRNGHRFCDPEMEAWTAERLAVESSLRRALAQGELVLHYQPQLDARTAAPVGAEALLRWQHPELGLLGPGLFLQVAEESGLILAIDAWVLRAACRQIRDWDREGLPAIPIAVNVSPLHLHQQDLAGLVWNALAETGVDPRRLELEITEGSFVRESETAGPTIERLRDLGLQVAIDDFGTGFSNLGYLKRFPVDRLKIAQVFIRDVAVDPQDEEIARTVISLGHSLGLQVLAEGVETREQLEVLRALDCDQIQGYYYARPMAAESFAQWLREPRHRRQEPEPPEVSSDEPAFCWG